MEGSVLWRGSRVGEQAVLKNCIIGSHSHIGGGCHAIDCVLGDNVTIAPGFKMTDGARIEPEAYLRPDAKSS